LSARQIFIGHGKKRLPLIPTGTAKLETFYVNSGKIDLLMKILLVASSNNEIKLLRDRLTFVSKISNNHSEYKLGSLDIDILVTGHGSVFMAYRLTRVLTTYSYDLAINVGLAGSFDYFLELGFVVNVIQDQFADLGFEEKESFFTLGEKELLNEDSFPFTGEILRSLGNFEIDVLESLIPVKSITVNTLHGRQESIQRVKKRFGCEIETMEGAAFFYTCLMEKIPFLQIRSISYFVEIPKVDNWNMPLALSNLTATVLDLFQELRSD
jgi:futalosine hydrolase